MNAPRVWAGLVVLIGATMAVSMVLERRPAPTTEQAVARAVTAQKETVYVERKVAAVQSRTVYRTLRDTLLRSITDTQLVKETLRQADTTIVKDSVALAAADSLIAAKDRELAIALKPHPAPRFRRQVALWYDPLTSTPSASVGASLRIVGEVSLTARVEQRAVFGERPRALVGVTLVLH